MTADFPRLISDSARLLKRSFEARARHLGITHEQSIVLAAVAGQEGISQVRLAELLEVETIAVCRLVDRLEASGAVRRERDGADRRLRRLYLTQAGWTTLERLRPLSQALTAEICAGIPARDLATARSVLQQIVDRLALATDGSRES